MERRVDDVLSHCTLVAPLVVATAASNATARFAAVLQAMATRPAVEWLPAHAGERARGNSATDRWMVFAATQAELDGFVAAVRSQVGGALAFTVGATRAITPRSLRVASAGVGTVKFQTGGPAHYARVALRVEPMVDDDNAITLQYTPANDFFAEWLRPSECEAWIDTMFRGVVTAAKLGALDGRACRGMRVTITDGRFHAVDSRENDFGLAAGLALEDALR